MTTLTERLAARATKTALEKGKGRSAFLALKPEVQSALSEGWKAKEIWGLLKDEGKIGVSYSVFLRYIREYIGGATEAEAAPGAPVPVGEPSQATSTETEPRRNASPAAPKFVHGSEPDRRSLV